MSDSRAKAPDNAFGNVAPTCPWHLTEWCAGRSLLKIRLTQ
jgi:hypothetical protein